MKAIPRFPYFPVQFDKEGRVFQPAEVQSLEAHLASQGTTDLIVLSHGWNNDRAEAEDLYEAFLTNADAALAKDIPPGLAARRFAVLGVLWPSKKFADEELIPSGAAGIGGALPASSLIQQLESLRSAFDAPDAAERIDRLKKLVPKLEDSAAAGRKFAEEVRKLVAGTGTDSEDGSDSFRLMDAGDLFERMSLPVSFVAPHPVTSEGGSAGMGTDDGGAAGLGGWFSGALSGARNLLNFTTYYQMKERAGRVGTYGVNPLIRTIQRIRADLRIHLVGHSFGGRLVAATAAAGGIRVASMSLLQAAFSHHGFSPDWNGKGASGLFRGVIDRKIIEGPVMVTCTTNDKAVGMAYPLASLLAGQTAAGLGDKDSIYGGIGRNGAQKTLGEAVDSAMQPVGGSYAFQGGKIYNLKADSFVKNHGDVANPNVVYAVLSAMSAVAAGSVGLASSTTEAEKRERIQRTLSKSVVALPLLEKINAELLKPKQPPTQFEVIVDAHLDYPLGRKVAREWILEVLKVLVERHGTEEARRRLESEKNKRQNQYVFATVTAPILECLVELDTKRDHDLEELGYPEKRARDGSFSNDDFRDVKFLAAKLRSAQDPLSVFIRDRLGDTAKKELGEWNPSLEPSKALRDGLMAGLNALLKLGPLWDSTRFENVTLSEGIQKLLRSSFAVERESFLNRLLLEHAYPEALKKLSERPTVPKAIYQVWDDFPIFPLIHGSIATVKADAARAAFKAAGRDIVWAVVDSGIAGDHPHFRECQNLQGEVSAWHMDFTGAPGGALVDDFGHGTHVAGIIAGEIPEPDRSVMLAGDPNLSAPVRRFPPASNPEIVAYQRVLKSVSSEGGREIEIEPIGLPSISGMAPMTKLVSLRVLDGLGRGNVSNIIAALSHIQEINGYGRRIRIHGVNLSVGYPFDPEWFACGQSQLCVEVDRLVRSGVAVVVAAGNTGYGTLSTDALGARKAGMALTINDPGNAQLAITVGSTHRTMPHVYGVSYFSAKGPTGDGRMKPDLLAPGEKVLSCATGKIRDDLMSKLNDDARARLEQEGIRPNYAEYTGTSMAAPHVSGCVAAFLSVKREFIGQPERVKEILMKTATDLGREPSFQGRGLVDLMRAIQFV